MGLDVSEYAGHISCWWRFGGEGVALKIKSKAKNSSQRIVGIASLSYSAGEKSETQCKEVEGEIGKALRAY